MANKWDGFSAFDSEKWDMKYQRGPYAPNLYPQKVLKVVAVGLVGLLAYLVVPKLTQSQKYKGGYDGQEYSSQQLQSQRRQQGQRYFKDEEAPRSSRHYRYGDILR